MILDATVAEQDGDGTTLNQIDEIVREVGDSAVADNLLREVPSHPQMSYIGNKQDQTDKMIYFLIPALVLVIAVLSVFVYSMFVQK